MRRESRETLLVASGVHPSPRMLFLDNERIKMVFE
jgi:hypothetical protein